MRKLPTESFIVQLLADHVCKKIQRKVISYLQSRTDAVQSGDGSELRDLWDEICVQKQGDESALWDAYDETVRSIVSGYLDGIFEFERSAIWLQTSLGEEWNREDDAMRESALVSNEDIVDYFLAEYLYPTAARWSNSRIRAFIVRATCFDW